MAFIKVCLNNLDSFSDFIIDFVVVVHNSKKAKISKTFIDPYKVIYIAFQHPGYCRTSYLDFSVFAVYMTF